MNILQTVLAGILAAVAAWGINYALLEMGFRKRALLIYIGTLGEEILKTGMSFLMGVPLAGVHAVFGIVEAGWELSGASRGRGRGGLRPALAAVAGHTLFGLLASLALVRSGRADLALVIGFLAHLVWNRLVLYLH
ncbi:hypothetical protein [Moorella sulfitireducens (nom. illeg.)]|uniref:hypothetical protein n=1 Tax=Neomoorella sulfitireducens TaxID=2972948 RepID=UPI0021ACEF4F|nr:hypothetical protein [Moorella sulfitireducens]